MKPSRLTTPYEEFKNCILCYIFIKELYRSNDLQNNTEEMLVSFSPEETLTFTMEPTVVKHIIDDMILQFSVINTGRKIVTFFSCNLFFFP